MKKFVLLLLLITAVFHNSKTYAIDPVTIAVLTPVAIKGAEVAAPYVARGLASGTEVITSDDPRSEKPEDIVRQIEEGIKKTNGKYKVIVDRAKAIEHALRQAQRNDLVLIAGKGHETYQEINGEKIHFDDREVIAEALKKLPEPKDKNLYAW